MGITEQFRRHECEQGGEQLVNMVNMSVQASKQGSEWVSELTSEHESELVSKYARVSKHT